MPRPINVVFPLFPGVVQLDFTGPHQVLSRLPNARLILASTIGGDLSAEDGITFAAVTRLADVDACDVICVPGGRGMTEALTDDVYMAHVRRLGRSARYVTSVCTGSLILAAAGFLRGKRAACHWAWRDLLQSFGAIPDPARVVRDGNIITGGGITAGIDFAFVLAEELSDRMTAQAIQLMLEYAPEPPFDAGRPETAPALVLERVRLLQAQSRPARAAAMVHAQRAVG